MDFFVVCVDETYRDAAVGLTMKLRSAGKIANFSYKAAKLGKQLKEASEQNAGKSIIVGDEFRQGKVAIKDMATGEQEYVDVQQYLSQLNL